MSDSPLPTTPHDVLIIGGGFAGASAALSLARAGRSVLVIDDGQPRNRFADHAHGYLTRDGAPPLELRDLAQAEAVGYGAVIQSGTVESISVEPDGRQATLVLADGQLVPGRRLLVTTGLTDVLPDIPGVAERWGRDAIHCPYCHGHEVRGQRLGLIVRPTPMTVHHALHLRQWSDRFTLFLNGDELPADEDLERLAARDIDVVSTPVAALEIDADQDKLVGVRLIDDTVVSIDAVFVMPLFNANTSLLEALGAEIEESVMGRQVRTDPTGRTTVPGVWAAGNAANAMAQLATAAAMGATAAGAINMDLALEDADLAVEAQRAADHVRARAVAS